MKLRELADVVVSSGVDPTDTGVLARVAGRAQVAGDRSPSSLRRAVEAKFAAAEAHERQAVLHRRAAENARAAAQAELDQLNQLEGK